MGRRYMAEILPIWRKTLSNQSINQSINQSKCDMDNGPGGERVRHNRQINVVDEDYGIPIPTSIYIVHIHCHENLSSLKILQTIERY